MVHQLDTFWLIHAGMAQEAGGGAQGGNSIWSHRSDLRYSVGRTLYQLLIVDMHPGRLSFTSGGKTYKLGTRSTSYDAALTLNDTQAFTLNEVNTADGVVTGPFNFAAKPAVSTFDDYNGYYPGFYYKGDGYLYYWNYPDSAVIPAAGNYSSRITDMDGNAFTDLYGYPMTPS